MHVALPKPRGGDKLPPAERRLGFLAAGRDATIGYVGGYLLTTARGRPLEFHYTSPVRPSATHRILYGAELEPYIFGELIAATLMRQSTSEPAFVITDHPLVLNQRPGASCPIICVAPAAPGADGTSDKEGTTHNWTSHPDYGQDLEVLNRWINEVNPGLDLREPFVRVWEALREVLTSDEKRAAA